MPNYTYFCGPCKKKFSISIPMGNKPPDSCVYCPECGKRGQVKRIWDKFSFVLKGTGWYKSSGANE